MPPKTFEDLFLEVLLYDIERAIDVDIDEAEHPILTKPCGGPYPQKEQQC